uniref:Uncharacterized protein n=1 Tax=Prymnesium polylepis TaxID=72548 RepID=A0A7S4M903_9EUKA|mmetsp:Transcript_21816/g.53591  ORF Transcript_21816/g.53591 Transcript_21816/m.53591 type:complete len:239 (+) Transcript_21816:3-719(+)
MEGSPMQGQYVNGIRNALLDIFTGADEQTVEANWAPLDAKARSIRDQIAALPNETLSFPLRDASNLTVTLKCNPGHGCFYPKPQLEAFLSAAECCALPPPKPTTHYIGTFSDGYYGTLRVLPTPAGGLRLQYGSVNCTIFPLYDKYDNATALICVPNLVLSLVVGPMPVVFDAGADKVSFFGGTFGRQAGAARPASLRDAPAEMQAAAPSNREVRALRCSTSVVSSGRSPFLPSTACA